MRIIMKILTKTIMKIVLTDSEVAQHIPFAELCECENKLKTIKAKRLMAKLGISSEMLSAYQQTARTWYLITGFPSGYEFTAEELDGWHLIGELISRL